MTVKLSKQDWLNFSLKELAKNGHEQLTANRLATKLGVSRGSFYWHFKDIKTFEVAVLNQWVELTTDDVIDGLRALKSPKVKLAALIKRTMDTDLKLERAVRSWSISNKMVAEVVQLVDARRVAYIESILEDKGVSANDLKLRAQMLNWASIGRTMMSDSNENTLLSLSALDRFSELLTS